MIRALILLALMTGTAQASEPYCYRGGLLCDCVTHVCEGDNFRRPLPAGSSVKITMHRDKIRHIVHRNRCWHAENHRGPFSICEQ